MGQSMLHMATQVPHFINSRESFHFTSCFLIGPCFRKSNNLFADRLSTPWDCWVFLIIFFFKLINDTLCKMCVSKFGRFHPFCRFNTTTWLTACYSLFFSYECVRHETGWKGRNKNIRLIQIKKKEEKVWSVSGSASGIWERPRQKH